MNYCINDLTRKLPDGKLDFLGIINDGNYDVKILGYINEMIGKISVIQGHD